MGLLRAFFQAYCRTVLTIMLSKDALDFSSDSEDDTPPQQENVATSQSEPVQHPKNSLVEASTSDDWVDEPEDPLRQTPIQNRYVFWFMHRGSNKGGANHGLDTFEQALIPVASFQVKKIFRLSSNVLIQNTFCFVFVPDR